MKTKHIIISLILIMISLIIINLIVGDYHLSFEQLINTLMFRGSSTDNLVIYQLRLPKIVGAIIMGCCLALGTYLLQNVLKNNVADPSYLGISSMSSLFVALLISLTSATYYQNISISTTLLIPIVSIVGSFIAIVLLFYLTKNKLNLNKMILSGIAINALVNAIMMFLQLIVNRGEYNKILMWSNGSLWSTSWINIIIVVPLMVIAIIVLIYNVKNIEINKLDINQSQCLGLDYKYVNFKLLILATLFIAISCSVGGSILFLGLLSVQIATKLSSNNLLVVTPLVGINIILLSQLVADNLINNHQLPVGLIIAIIGAPVFIYLLIKRK